jgi:hypothetical protein
MTKKTSTKPRFARFKLNPFNATSVSHMWQSLTAANVYDIFMFKKHREMFHNLYFAKCVSKWPVVIYFTNIHTCVGAGSELCQDLFLMHYIAKTRLPFVMSLL